MKFKLFKKYLVSKLSEILKLREEYYKRLDKNIGCLKIKNIFKLASISNLGTHV